MDPITLQELKDYLKIDSDESDADLRMILRFAIDFVERETGQRLAERSDVFVLDRFPFKDRDISLPWPPLVSIESVTYTLNGSTTTLSASDYVVLTDGKPGRLALKSSANWPATDDQAGAVRIAYTAGHETAADVPATLRQCVLWIAAHVHEGRLPEDRLATSKDLPFALRAAIEMNTFREAA